ncbi:hypothetical protein ACLOAV_003917 [Pseudogymnoascus australis]
MSGENSFAPAWLEFEKELGGRQALHGPTFDDLFKGWTRFSGVLGSKLTFPAPDISVKTEDKAISPDVTVRIYTPPNYTGGKPVGIFIHGGGWVFGDLDGEDAFCRSIAIDTGTVLVSVDYRLAPKHKYPIALDDCVATYHWAIENTGYLNTTAGQVFTIGGSAGGGLALGLALNLIDAGLGETVKGVVALVPVTVHPDACPAELKSGFTSYEENAEYTINTNSAMRAFFEAYDAPLSDHYTSPLLHKRIKDLPRTYIATAGMDTLRDDGRLFKKALDNAGVPNRYDEFEGYPHWFWAFPSKHLESITKDFHEKLQKAIEFILS